MSPAQARAAPSYTHTPPGPTPAQSASKPTAPSSRCRASMARPRRQRALHLDNAATDARINSDTTGHPTARCIQSIHALQPARAHSRCAAGHALRTADPFDPAHLQLRGAARLLDPEMPRVLTGFNLQAAIPAINDFAYIVKATAPMSAGRSHTRQSELKILAAVFAGTPDETTAYSDWQAVFGTLPTNGSITWSLTCADPISGLAAPRSERLLHSYKSEAPTQPPAASQYPSTRPIKRCWPTPSFTWMGCPWRTKIPAGVLP